MRQIKICPQCNNKEIAPEYNFCKYCGSKLQLQEEEVKVNTETVVSNRLLSEKELADELGISPWTVRTLRLRQNLPHIKSSDKKSARIFYRLDNVMKWMAEQEKTNSKKDEKNTGPGTLRRID